MNVITHDIRERYRDIYEEGIKAEEYAEALKEAISEGREEGIPEPIDGWSDEDLMRLVAELKEYYWNSAE